jgi:hypothetical protein
MTTNQNILWEIGKIVTMVAFKMKFKCITMSINISRKIQKFIKK